MQLISQNLKNKVMNQNRIDIGSFAVKDFFENNPTIHIDQRRKTWGIIRNYPGWAPDQSKKPNKLFKLTLPLWLLFMMLMVVLMPFKWLVTGDLLYADDGALMSFYESWHEKLNM